MAARLTDAQKKKVIADFAECGNYAATGRMNGISDKTVKTIVMADPETSRISEQKKAENTADMLAFMESRKNKAQNVIDRCLDILPKKLDKASASQTATVLGIVIDKFTRQTDAGMDFEKVMKNMNTLADVVRHPAPDRDIHDFE